MTAYALYNEIDEHAADWLENLIKADLIAPGIVDRRSIEDLRGDDLRGFRQVHFFAGIGVWSYALRCAGVPDDFPVWTGSCPCQPFSAAGKGTGMDDERHLWPALFHLIRERRPERILGEQVASSDGLNWLDLVSTDLEAEAYAIGTVDTCSAGHGAPHIRQRLRFCAYDPRRARVGRLADADGRDARTEGIQRGWQHGQQPQDGGALVWLDNNNNKGLEGFWSGPRTETGQREGSLRSVAETGELGGMADDDDERFERSGSARGRRARPSDIGSVGSQEHAIGGQIPQPHGRAEARDGQRPDRPDFDRGTGRPGPTNGFWRDADWLFCRDERWRPVEPGTFPLVDGSAFRVDSGGPYAGKSRQGILKGYGNAIDAQATIDFIEACMEYRPADRDRIGGVEGLLV